MSQLSMLTVFALLLFVYSCRSLEIADEIDNCNTTATTPCIIPLDASIIHTLAKPITNTDISTTAITITSSSTEPAQISVTQSLTLTNYASTITFDNIVITGNSPNKVPSFIQIDTNLPMQINIVNSKINNFNTSLGVIRITSNIKSFIVDVNNTAETILVDYIYISDTFMTINFTNSQFENNENYQTNGGVLSLTCHEFKIHINQCNFSNNKATALRKNDGCIAWDRSEIPDPYETEIDNAIQTFKENGIDVNAIYQIYDLSNTAGTSIINASIHIENSEFYNNNAKDAGGVFYVIQTKSYYSDIFNISGSDKTTFIPTTTLFTESIKSQNTTTTPSEYCGAATADDAVPLRTSIQKLLSPSTTSVYYENLQNDGEAFPSVNYVDKSWFVTYDEECKNGGWDIGPHACYDIDSAIKTCDKNSIADSRYNETTKSQVIEDARTNTYYADELNTKYHGKNITDKNNPYPITQI